VVEGGGGLVVGGSGAGVDVGHFDFGGVWFGLVWFVWR
jgi:hypothetical protein